MPLNNYALTKSKAEDTILEINKSSLIIRTNFFGWGPSYKKSFSDKIISYLETNKKIELFNDVYFTPISIIELKNQIFKPLMPMEYSMLYQMKEFQNMILVVKLLEPLDIQMI